MPRDSRPTRRPRARREEKRPDLPQRPRDSGPVPDAKLKPPHTKPTRTRDAAAVRKSRPSSKDAYRKQMPMLSAIAARRLKGQQSKPKRQLGTRTASARKHRRDAVAKHMEDEHNKAQRYVVKAKKRKRYRLIMRVLAGLTIASVIATLTITIYAGVKHAMDSALEAKYDKSASGGYEEVDYEYDYDDYDDSYAPPVFDVETDPPTEPTTTSTTTTTTTTTPIPTSTASTTTTDDPKFNFDDFCEDKPRLTKYKYKSDCDYYIYCVFNFGNLVPCPPGLTYNDETKECDENECEEDEEEGEERKKRSGWLERLTFGQERWHELWKMFGT